MTAALERHEAYDRLPLQFVGTAYYGRLGDRPMGLQRAFDLHRAQPMARDVDHVVDAAHQPQVAVLVAAGAVAGEVGAGNLTEVLTLITIRIAEDRPQHPR